MDTAISVAKPKHIVTYSVFSATFGLFTLLIKSFIDSMIGSSSHYNKVSLSVFIRLTPFSNNGAET